MNKGYPTIVEAKNIFKQCVDFRRNNPPAIPQAPYNEEEFIAHSYNVAEAARKIADRTAYLNPDKAYILGLLHDYGKMFDERVVDKSHGQIGYEMMIKKDYPEVARICLTHTFVDKNFEEKDFWYPINWQKWIKDKLKDIEYDDYDRLIQLSDKFAEKLDLVSIEYRSERLKQRYNLSDEVTKIIYNEGMQLKKYFDKLCGEDIYKILGIKE